MEGLKIHLIGWEDGERVEKDVEVTDRWELHQADEVQITLADATIKLKQQPKALNATRMGVGACVWEGELLLAAYLAGLPRHRYIGATVIELGSGPGLAGLLLAALGANVVLTDIAKVLPLIQDNVDHNKLGRKGQASGWCDVRELEWGAPGYEQVVGKLAAQAPVDWVIAADCTYIDNEGTSPSTPHFIHTCAMLCASSDKARCLVSFELRSSLVKSTFLEEAAKAFNKVIRVPPSQLPKGCQVEHIELYELAGVKPRS